MPPVGVPAVVAERLAADRGAVDGGVAARRRRRGAVRYRAAAERNRVCDVRGRADADGDGVGGRCIRVLGERDRTRTRRSRVRAEGRRIVVRGHGGGADGDRAGRAAGRRAVAERNGVAPVARVVAAKLPTVPSAIAPMPVAVAELPIATAPFVPVAFAELPIATALLLAVLLLPSATEPVPRRIAVAERKRTGTIRRVVRADRQRTRAGCAVRSPIATAPSPLRPQRPIATARACRAAVRGGAGRADRHVLARRAGGDTVALGDAVRAIDGRATADCDPRRGARRHRRLPADCNTVRSGRLRPLVALLPIATAPARSDGRVCVRSGVVPLPAAPPMATEFSALAVAPKPSAVAPRRWPSTRGRRTCPTARQTTESPLPCRRYR